MNALAGAASTYLRSAADQPVDWMPWSADAFGRAREENKPVLLDIGASWCHWCHVMDRESYENPAVAKQLNADWVCIKVDRDERPDVDARYQRAVQALSGQGGWPLTAFLTPAGDVFYGGTYFPPDDAHGRPGFGTVLQQLAKVYRERPDTVVRQAQEIRTHLETHQDRPAAGDLHPDVLDEAARNMARLFDPRHGGFGTRPKFPHPAACDFLRHRAHDTGDAELLEMVHRTLTAMARGGICDQLGGGFHRYSVDAEWIVPHFEKMSYDNSELLRAYVRWQGWQGRQGRRALYDRTIRGIADWVMDVLADPDGGYGASQDADVGLDDDGDYFTWTLDEMRAAGLDDDEFALAQARFGAGERGHMQHDLRRNVLHVARTAAELAEERGRDQDDVGNVLASARDKLLAARAARETPAVDPTRYTAWNAMMASAMLDAAALLDDQAIEQHALRSLGRLFADTALDDGAGGFRHAPGSDVTGLLEDDVHVAAASLDAWEVSADHRWRERAERIMERVWTTYRSDDGLLLDRAHGTGEGFLDQPMTPVHDAPTPSPNGVAAVTLARLAAHTGDGRWRTRQTELLQSVAAGLADLHVHGATLLLGLDWNLSPVTHVVVTGGPDAAALRRAARRAGRPRTVIVPAPPDADPSTLPEPVRAMLSGETPRAYICVGTHCEAPVATPDALEEALASG